MNKGECKEYKAKQVIPLIHINGIEVLARLPTVFDELIFRIVFADSPVNICAILNKLLDKLYSQAFIKRPVAA
jgi:hypothetical protein